MASERIELENRMPRGMGLGSWSPGEAAPGPPHTPAGGKLRLAVPLLIFAALLALTFLVLRPVSAALRQRMEILRDELLSRGEELIGRQIEYESLGPSFLGGIDIRSLKVTGKGPRPLFAAARFHVSWSLWDLLTGGRGALRGLRIDGPELYLDPREDRDLPEILDRLKSLAGEGGGAPIPGVFSFRIRNGGISLAELGRLSGLNLDAEIRGGRIEAQGLWDAQVRFGAGELAGLSSLLDGSPAPLFDRFPGLPPALQALFGDSPALNLSAAARFRLSCETDLSRGEAFLSLPSVTEDRFKTGPLELNLALKDRVLSLSNTPPGMTGPLILALDYGLDTGDLALRLNCRGYSPGDTVKFQGPWKDYAPFLGFRTSGEAALTRSGGGVLEYRADISGLVPPNLPLARSGFKVKLAGNGDRVSFEPLELALARTGNTPGGALSFQGSLDLKSLSPNGTAGIRDLSFTGQGGINAELTLRSRGKDLNIFGETFTIGAAEFTALELDLHREAEGLSFTASALRFYESPDGADQVGMSSIRADGNFDYTPRHLETRFTLDSFSARDFMEIALPLAEKFEFSDTLPPLLPAIWENLLDNTLVTTEIFATTDFSKLLYNAPRLVISYSGYGDLIALFSVSGTDRRFTVDGGQILWDGGSAQITGLSDFSNTENISFSLNVGFQDINYYLEGALLDRRSVSIEGSHGLNAFMSSQDGAYSGRVRGENIPVLLGERLGRFSFDLGMGYRSTESWYLDLAGFELADFAAPDPLGNAGVFRFSGRADQSQLALRDIYLNDSQGVLRGGGIFSAAGGEDGVYQGSLSVLGESHLESYAVDLSWVPGAAWKASHGGGLGNLAWQGAWPAAFLDSLLESRPSPPASPVLSLRVSGIGMRPARFFRKLPNVQADGDFSLEWNSPGDFNASVDIRSLGIGRGSQAINAGGRAFVDQRGFRVQDLRLTMGALEALVPSLRLSMDESLIEGGGRIQGKVSGSELGLNFSLDSRFAPVDSWLDYRAALEDLRGSIELTDITFAGRTREESFNFGFSRQGEGMVFAGGPEDMIFFDIKGGGAFIAAFADPFPLRGTFQGTLSLDSIDARGEGIVVNLPALWQFIPSKEDFEISAGYAVGSLQIRGPLGNPEIYGSARGENLRMRVPKFLSADIVPAAMQLVFDGNEMRFTNVSAACGRGLGVVSGQFWLEKWIPGSFSLDITAAKDRPLPFMFDIGGILARGTASGSLNLTMTDLVLNVSGDLVAQETEISLDAAEIAASQREDSWGNLPVPVIADVAVTAGRKVEFLWPTREFPMLQAYADQGARTRIYANSLDRTFTFTGDVKLRSGEVFYFERSFYIRNGMLSFREDQTNFDPRITVRAEIRDRASNGPVTISMVVDNAPLQSFTPRFESSPAMSQTEILSLLGQNFVGAAGADGSVSNPFLSSSADLLSQSRVMRRVQGALRDLLHLDMFSIRTQFIQRAAFSFIGLEESPVDRIGWVGNYFDNTSVFIGKYIGSEMFAQAMLSLRYDENKRSFGGYTFEPDFGIELRSPLGNIRWNLVPTHPENWYIDDCSFTISWNFSF
ncbi:MAG: translocation/assembly module TamB [Treponema sp.]|nr:translocation/assembly module TamB [Treponema sp.]